MLIFNELILEVTRRCNMECAHCLRGDYQNKDMSREVITEIRSKINGVGDLTLSGGEPTIAIEVLENIAQMLEFPYSPEVNFMFMATNGKTIKRGLFNIMERIIMQCSDPHECRICLSNDEYHTEFLPRFSNWEKWIKWGEKFTKENWHTFNGQNIVSQKHLWGTSPHTRTDSPFDIVSYSSFNPIRMGRLYYSTELSEYKPNNQVDIIKENDYIEVFAELYVTVDGDIILGCDYSYNMMEDVKIASIFDSEEEIVNKLASVN